MNKNRVIEKLLIEWSYRCPDGIVDMNNPDKLKILNEILKENGINEEIKADSLRIGVSFNINGDLGNFKKGDRLTIKDKKTFNNNDDIELYFTNQDGVEDIFVIDKNDNFEGEISEIKTIEEDESELINNDENQDNNWSNGFKEGYVRAYEDAIAGKKNIFSLDK